MEQEKIIIEVDETELEGPESAQKPSMRVLKFCLGDEYFCVLAAAVREVIKLPDVTRVPLTPEFVVGVINLRGEIIPVLDIRQLLGVAKNQKEADERIIVTDAAGFPAGILADAVEGTENIEEEIIQEPLATLKQELHSFTRGQFQRQERIFTFLDIEKVLKSERIESLKKGDTA